MGNILVFILKMECEFLITNSLMQLVKLTKSLAVSRLCNHATRSKSPVTEGGKRQDEPQTPQVKSDTAWIV